MALLVVEPAQVKSNSDDKKFKMEFMPESFLQAPSGLSTVLSPLVQLLAVKLASPQDIPGHSNSKRYKHMMLIKTGLRPTWTGS